jgi:hypothetical protein
MNKAVTGGVCVVVAETMGLPAAIIAGSGLAVLLMAVFTIIGPAVAVGAMIVAP